MIFHGSIPSYGCKQIYLIILLLVDIKGVSNFLLSRTASLMVNGVGYILRSRISFSRDRYLALWDLCRPNAIQTVRSGLVPTRF